METPGDFKGHCHLTLAAGYLLGEFSAQVFWWSGLGQTGNILVLQIVWSLSQKWRDGWQLALPAFYEHAGLRLCKHAGHGDGGTWASVVVAVTNLFLKSSTIFSFYVDVLLYRVFFFNSSICQDKLFSSIC